MPPDYYWGPSFATAPRRRGEYNNFCRSCHDSCGLCCVVFGCFVFSGIVMCCLVLFCSHSRERLNSDGVQLQVKLSVAAQCFEQCASTCILYQIQCICTVLNAMCNIYALQWHSQRWSRSKQHNTRHQALFTHTMSIPESHLNSSHCAPSQMESIAHCTHDTHLMVVVLYCVHCAPSQMETLHIRHPSQHIAGPPPSTQRALAAQQKSRGMNKRLGGR